jgi:hypothetical protein
MAHLEHRHGHRLSRPMGLRRRTWIMGDGSCGYCHHRNFFSFSQSKVRQHGHYRFRQSVPRARSHIHPPVASHQEHPVVRIARHVHRSHRLRPDHAQDLARADERITRLHVHRRREACALYSFHDSLLFNYTRISSRRPPDEVCDNRRNSLFEKVSKVLDLTFYILCAIIPLNQKQTS